MDSEKKQRPKIHCFMLVSLDGKATGKFLFSKACSPFIDAFMKLDTTINADGFICGKKTLEEGYTKDEKIDLSPFQNSKISKSEDFIVKQDSSWKKYYAIAFDRKGNLQWSENHLKGNANKKILEVLTEKASDDYLAYLVKAAKTIYGVDSVSEEELINMNNTPLKKLSCNDIASCFVTLCEAKLNKNKRVRRK